MAAATLAAMIAGSAAARAQTAKGPPAPYATIAARGASYLGPGREAAYDLPGDTVRIGLMAPLHGPQKAEGDAIVAAAQLAIADASQSPLPGGRRLELAVGDESGPSWGHAANALIKLVFDQHAVAVVTSASGDLAHLSEQVGNRIGVPILTLSSDSTTTQTDIPWIFRLAPSDAAQAAMIAQNVYRRWGFRRVVLVSARDHDGRMGANAFEKAVQSLGAPAPAAVRMNPFEPDYDSLLALVKAQAPQAVVIWTRSGTARTLVRLLGENGVRAAIYLSQQASQDFAAAEASSPPASAAGAPVISGLWTPAAEPSRTAIRRSFVQRYRSATGRFPSSTAAEAYDAVRLLADALREAGPNRARVRDQVASARDVSGVSGRISFDPEGNSRAGVQIVHLQ